MTSTPAFTIPTYTQKDFRKNKFTKLNYIQTTESNKPEMRHILDLGLHALILNISNVHPSVNAQKDILNNAQVNMHPHKSWKANQGGNSNDKAVLYAIDRYLKTGEKQILPSNAAKHLKDQQEVILHESFKETFDSDSDYQEYVAHWVQITKNLLGPKDSKKFKPNKPIIDGRKFRFVDSIFKEIAKDKIDDVIDDSKLLADFQKSLRKQKSQKAPGNEDLIQFDDEQEDFNQENIQKNATETLKTPVSKYESINSSNRTKENTSRRKWILRRSVKNIARKGNQMSIEEKESLKMIVDSEPKYREVLRNYGLDINNLDRGPAHPSTITNSSPPLVVNDNPTILPPMHLRTDGALDMRYRENRTDLYHNGVHYGVSGALDMRYLDNRSMLFHHGTHYTMGGGLDMRYQENRGSLFSGGVHYTSSGALDMRYIDNRSSLIQNGIHLRKDGQPDRRYKENW
eukprot:gene12941-14181_t